ncbi:hypothetical protein SFRURICE_009529 [Spodoptera frugiperda]|uniref:SFRICE_013886 n=1 Tax=Spodoptera frugiperda TaxID=7108 RepID=A0A2H1VRR1_SPOFR|nr:uncharacterized protein LOC118264981 [Spodoptera frugiperda]KAF9794152.1 hypothetical protein SFRURICE_009529 [Spodoptera frugiperda]
MIEEDNKTVWCGNLPEQVTEEILYELFLQAGPLEKVRIPRDRDGRQKNFAFITYCHEVSVPYALNLFRGTSLFHRTLTLQSRGRMVTLPPPIRCYGLEPPLEFPQQSNIAQQFVEMADHLKEEDFKLPNRQANDSTDRLVVASLQGNWSHRHHPYRSKDISLRDDYRPSRKQDSKGKYSSNWRDRRNKKNSYHR